LTTDLLGTWSHFCGSLGVENLWMSSSKERVFLWESVFFNLLLSLISKDSLRYFLQLTFL
jgi:hypothetical protein